ncbi:protein IMPACT-B-like isoform X2 [Penaeus monodon]|uniref:protein IMPACT-B-like isoform X2 n=1 Tax=Penaeus monodon TaxID=6687 RepID=UPI0018A71833|nr:protein IMPACT-B-like isoform X2 [Penaeus monodon]
MAPPANSVELWRERFQQGITIQNDEIEALSAIYGIDFHTESAEHRTYSIDITEGVNTALLQVTMPPEYPGESPPMYMLSAPWLKGMKRQELCGYLEEIYLENAGESIVYMWVEKIREFMTEQAAHEPVVEEKTSITDAVDKLKLSFEEEVQCPEIYSGDIISDRKSHFQPHLAAVRSTAEVNAVLRKLYQNKKVANATHNMYAYRFICEGSSNLHQDCEDDGEDHAGGRMLHLLQIVGAQNVLVVVTRWYGGIHLGPDRFRHINNAARQILENCGYIKHQESCKKNKKTK